MNKQRRTALTKALELLSQAATLIEGVHEGEQEAYDNIPESLQQAERGEGMYEHLDALSIIIDELANADETISEIIGN